MGGSLNLRLYVLGAVACTWGGGRGAKHINKFPWESPDNPVKRLSFACFLDCFHSLSQSLVNLDGQTSTIIQAG